MRNRTLLYLILAALSAVACNSVPSRSGAEDLIRKELGAEQLYGKDDAAAQFTLDRVMGITTPDANTLRVEFTFHWVPQNDAAKKLAALAPEDQTTCPMSMANPVWGSNKWCLPLGQQVLGTAIFVKYDDGWRLKKVLA